MLPFLADLPPGYFITLAFVFGLAFGSFLNVVIHRLPLGLNLALPASHCHACEHALAWSDNIPLVSYLLLRGRCRYCATAIGWRYPLVELLTALVWAGLAWHTGATWRVIFQMTFALFLIALAFIDAEHHLLPDVLTYPLLLLACAASLSFKISGISLSPEITYDVFFTDPAASFVPRRAALWGGLVLALAAPCMLLIDWVDELFFARYFVEEELAETGERETLEGEASVIQSAEEIPPPLSPAEQAALAAMDERCDRQRSTVILISMVAGLIGAIIWAVWALKGGDTFTRQRAYEGLTDAAFGAFIAGGVIWLLRALYFWLRGAEGMGLGDVKMMAGVGAFLGWIPAFAVLLYGSILGAVIGVIIASRHGQGWQTPLPFGSCLALAALVVLFN